MTNSVLVDGVNGASGLIYLHYAFGIAPIVTTSSSAPIVAEGGTLSLTPSIEAGTPTAAYQWYHNGTLIPDATSSTYTRFNLPSTAAGTYSLVASNIIGKSSNVVARNRFRFVDWAKGFSFRICSRF